MKNKDLAPLNPTSFLSVKGVSSPSHSKKIEGFDKLATSTGFSTKIQKIKQKPKVEVIEDQYVKGLQDEINFLELELKLLQQKDMQKHGQIDQLEKFFGDGIPINQNILAIKNGFNNYKTSFEKKTGELAAEKNERAILINQLSLKVDSMVVQVTKNEKEWREIQTKANNNFHDLIKKESMLRRQADKDQFELSGIKSQNRKIFEEMEKISRNKLVENISILKNENHKHTKLNLLKETMQEKEEEYKTLLKQFEYLAKKQKQKSYVIDLEQQNLVQKKKAISIQRELDNLRIKVKQRQMDLEQKLKERANQIHSKNDVRYKVTAIKDLISKQNSLTDEAVQKYGKEKEIALLQKILEENRKISKYTDYYSNLLTQTENQIQKLAQRKPELKLEITTIGQDLQKAKQSFAQQKQRECKLYGQIHKSDELGNYYKNSIQPIVQKSNKNNKQIELYLNEKKILDDDIKIKEKQLQLIFIIRALNFEQAEMAKTSSNNIEQDLNRFLKSWDQIQKFK